MNCFPCHIIAVAAASFLLACTPTPATAQQRALGLDISAWQGNISQTTWSNISSVENRQFVFLRASRGGTTGEYHAGGGYPAGDNTFFNLSQRYDDPYFVQNINRATSAGMFAGSYHFGRMDVVASTPNTNGIPNNGTDEANHFIQMAGAFMRPGYLLPVFDFEAGSGIRSPSELAQFAIDFSNRINEVMGIRPAVYIGGNYASPMNAIPESSAVAAAYTTLWTARWPNQADPNSIPVHTADPGDFTPSVYGPWDNPPNPTDPWHFWQYASTGRLNSFNSGGSNLDFDVAHGGNEYLKDHLVPAIWVSNTGGEWTTLDNWNSGRAPVAPPPLSERPGQLAPIGTQTMPAARLPGAAGAGVTSGQHDTVILDHPTADITVTHSSGTHNVRKLFVRETLNITGGSLAVSYDPTVDSTSGPISAQFSGSVALSAGASLSVNTLQVDAAQTFTMHGGTLTLKQIHLMPHSSAPAKIAILDDVTLNPLANASAAIANGSGLGSSGLIDFGGADRGLNVGNGLAEVDLAVNVPITNGALTKGGPGTLALGGANSYSGNTTVQAGKLSIASAYLADAANVYLTSGSTLDLNFTGNDVVRSLFFDGLPQSDGIWGAVGSGAQFTSPFLTGTGRLHITQVPPPPPPPGPDNVLDNFEVDEGHFGWAYNTSPLSQTFGLSGSTAIDRVTSEHQGAGTGSQLLNLVSDGSANWQLRHNSGIGIVANPAGNVPLEATGYVGFWLKTDDPGITVRIGIDDPIGNTALERGTELSVIADNEWHLYQWNVEDENDWFAFAGGANGIIDAVNGSVTIDSIWFAGSGNAQIHLDQVSHNPDGQLANIPEPASLLLTAMFTIALVSRRSVGPFCRKGP